MNTSAYRVIFGDTDQMGVVYYANYLRLFERGRCEYMRQAEMSYADVEAAGFHLPVVDAHVSYKTFAKFDDLLQIETRIESRTRIKLRFAYKITRGDDVIATGHTVHACVRRTDGRPARLPPAVDVLLEQHNDLNPATSNDLTASQGAPNDL